jgi:hypothetical protein
MQPKQQVKGGDAVQRVLAALPDDDRKSLGMLLTAQWYPFELGKRLDAAIVAEVGGGREEYFERLGEASAEKNLATVHRNFVTQRDAHGFLAKAPTIYKLYYGTGRREYEKTGERSGRLTTHDAENFSAPDCLTPAALRRRQRARRRDGMSRARRERLPVRGDVELR